MELTEIKLEDIRPNPNNPRRDWGDLEALRRSIVDIGLLNPLVVVRDGNVYRLVAGERRFRAIREIPHAVFCQCLVADDMDEANEMVALMGDNAYRKDLDEDEAARGVQQMLILGVGERKVSGASGCGMKAVAAFNKALGYVRRAEADGCSSGRQLTFDEAMMLSEFDWETEGETIEALLGADHMDDEYYRITRERAELERVRKGAAEIAESGATEIPLDEYRKMDWRQRVAYVGGKRVGRDGCGCDGFSATLTNYGVEWYCTKPENHPDKVDPEESARRERHERWNALTDARAAFIVGKFNSVNGGADLTYWMQESVSDLLDGHFETLVEGMEDRPDKTFFRICTAFAWSKAESSLYTIMESDVEWNDAEKARFMKMLLALEKLGYELSEEEREAVGHCADVLRKRTEKK